MAMFFFKTHIGVQFVVLSQMFWQNFGWQFGGFGIFILAVVATCCRRPAAKDERVPQVGQRWERRGHGLGPGFRVDGQIHDDQGVVWILISFAHFNARRCC